MGSITEALGASFPLALAIAASPAAIIAMIILLMTRKALPNAWSFLAGWFAGLMLVGLIFLHRPAFYEASGEPSLILGWVRISIGATVFIAGLFMLVKILKKEKQEDTPGWARKVDSFGFLHSFGLGFFFAAPNLKNASMVTTGAASIGNVGLGSFEEMSVLILFCLLATIGVMLPPLIFLLFRDKAEPIFEKMKVWLVKYGSMVLVVICIVFGGLFIYQGIEIVKSY